MHDSGLWLSLAHEDLTNRRCAVWPTTGNQIIVSTLGDLISARVITAGAGSTQWLGHMSDAPLQQLSQNRSSDAKGTRRGTEEVRFSKPAIGLAGSSIDLTRTGIIYSNSVAENLFVGKLTTWRLIRTSTLKGILRWRGERKSLRKPAGASRSVSVLPGGTLLWCAFWFQICNCTFLSSTLPYIGPNNVGFF